MTSKELAQCISRDIRQRLDGGTDPVIVMITGPPATGKTTLSRNIREELGPEGVVTLCDDRELHTRDVRRGLGISGIDPRARNMLQNVATEEDLFRLSRGQPIREKAYKRLPNTQPDIVDIGELAPGSVILLDGFAWCYPDFDGMWDLKYVLLPYLIKESELMSIERDLRERFYVDTEAHFKHFLCYRTYIQHRDILRDNAQSILGSQVDINTSTRIQSLAIC
ncbi:MAG: hypothetical protein ACKV22_23685 [Bryobacteraceae bacterium]